jgi:hypothetical protein
VTKETKALGTTSAQLCDYVPTRSYRQGQAIGSLIAVQRRAGLALFHEEIAEEFSQKQ